MIWSATGAVESFPTTRWGKQCTLAKRWGNKGMQPFYLPILGKNDIYPELFWWKENDLITIFVCGGILYSGELHYSIRALFAGLARCGQEKSAGNQLGISSLNGGLQLGKSTEIILEKSNWWGFSNFHVWSPEGIVFLVRTCWPL